MLHVAVCNKINLVIAVVLVWFAMQPVTAQAVIYKRDSVRNVSYMGYMQEYRRQERTDARKRHAQNKTLRSFYANNKDRLREKSYQEFEDDFNAKPDAVQRGMLESMGQDADRRRNIQYSLGKLYIDNIELFNKRGASYQDLEARFNADSPEGQQAFLEKVDPRQYTINHRPSASVDASADRFLVSYNKSYNSNKASSLKYMREEFGSLPDITKVRTLESMAQRIADDSDGSITQEQVLEQQGVTDFISERTGVLDWFFDVGLVWWRLLQNQPVK